MTVSYTHLPGVHGWAQIRPESHDERPGDEEDEADQVRAPDADDVADGTHRKDEGGDEQGIQPHPQCRVRIVETAVIRQGEDKNRNQGEVGHAVEELYDVGEPEIFGYGF